MHTGEMRQPTGTRPTIAGILALVFAVASSTSVEARKGRFPVAIPGMGKSEVIQKVVDLPDIPALRRPDGTYIDLGYLHHKNGQTGEWIGYVGSSTSYLKMSPQRLNALLAIAGLRQLPATPDRPWFSGISTFWLVVMLIGVLALAWRGVQVLMRNMGDEKSDGRPIGSAAAAEGDSLAAMEKAMEEAVARHKEEAGKTKPATAQRRPRVGGFGQPVQAASFGRRG
ncbi:MAG: hypothetical protein RLZ98_357 [Pseudomonadota bacterium]|jgi:hypothetical protein